MGKELFNEEVSVVRTGCPRQMTIGGDLLELLQDDGFLTTTHTLGQTNHNPLHTMFETALPLRQNSDSDPFSPRHEVDDDLRVYLTQHYRSGLAFQAVHAHLELLSGI